MDSEAVRLSSISPRVEIMVPVTSNRLEPQRSTSIPTRGARRPASIPRREATNDLRIAPMKLVGQRFEEGGESVEDDAARVQ